MTHAERKEVKPVAEFKYGAIDPMSLRRAITEMEQEVRRAQGWVAGPFGLAVETASADEMRDMLRRSDHPEPDSVDANECFVMNATACYLTEAGAKVFCEVIPEIKHAYGAGSLRDN